MASLSACRFDLVEWRSIRPFARLIGLTNFHAKTQLQCFWFAEPAQDGLAAPSRPLASCMSLVVSPNWLAIITLWLFGPRFRCHGDL